MNNTDFEFSEADLSHIFDAINAVRNSLNIHGVQERSPEEQSAVARLQMKLGHRARKVELSCDESKLLIENLGQYSTFLRRKQRFIQEDEVDSLLLRLYKVFGRTVTGD